MNESDHSDKESQDEMPALEVSSDSVNGDECGRKRRREESAEDSSFCAPAVKKLCGSVDDAALQVQVSRNERTPELNGDSKEVCDGKDDPEVSSIVDTEKEGETASEGTASAKKSNVGRDDVESTVASSDKCVESEKEEDASNLSTVEVAEGRTTAARVTSDTEDTATKAKTSEVEDDDEVKTVKKKRGKSRIEDAEVVEGLELSVECASDKESSSSSGSEGGGDRKPLRKTIIVKAKPNDSELDVGSSEAEKSDLQDTRESKVKQRTRKGKKRGKSVGDSEGNNDDVSDEDYSPRTKRKLKKATATKKAKAAKSSGQSKRGRGKGKKGSKGPMDTGEGDEDENSNVTEEKKADENASGDAESAKAASESNECDSGDNSKDGTGKKASLGSDDKTIEQLKKYIRITGIHVKSYSDLWTDCKSHAAKVRRLKELLEKNGVSGRPTMEKCKRARERNERLKDVAELNTSNIISEGRVTRAQRNKDSIKELRRSPEPLAKRNTYKRVLSVVDSDSE